MLIFFDIDQTLIDFQGAERAAVAAVYDEWFRESKVSAHELYQVWSAVGAVHFKKYLQGEQSFEQQRLNRIKELYETVAGEHISDQTADRVFERYLVYFEANWRVFDDVRPCLESLAGRRLGIISNGDDEQQRKKLEKCGIAPYFEVVVTSGKVGKAKPDPYIFEMACKEAMVKPEECVYVGDQWSVDMVGCRAYQMRGIWINRSGLPNEGEDAVTIARLTQLPEHL